MTIYYENTDISNDCDVISCIHTDACGDRSDGMELVLDHAEDWYRWKPRTDDVIRVTEGDYDTGKLYINAIAPQGGGRFRIFASASKSAAKRKECDTFRSKTLEEIAEKCAGRSGMDYNLYGMDGKTLYSYVCRLNESSAEFLNRLCRMEGAAVKAVNGAFALIDIRSACRREAAGTIEIAANTAGAAYYIRPGNYIREMVVHGPGFIVREVSQYIEGSVETEAMLPCRTRETAQRFARGLMLMRNMENEHLVLSTGFNPTFAALERIDITGGTEMDGKWLMISAVHDLYRKKSTAEMLRVIGE